MCIFFRKLNNHIIYYVQMCVRVFYKQTKMFFVVVVVVLFITSMRPWYGIQCSTAIGSRCMWCLLHVVHQDTYLHLPGLCGTGIFQPYGPRSPVQNALCASFVRSNVAVVRVESIFSALHPFVRIPSIWFRSSQRQVPGNRNNKIIRRKTTRSVKSERQREKER